MSSEPSGFKRLSKIVFSLKAHQPFLFIIFVNGITFSVLGLLISSLPVPLLIPCTFPLAQKLSFALVLSLGIHLFLLDRNHLFSSSIGILIYASLVLLILWFGSFPYSPLGFSINGLPVLRGFLITRFGRPAETIRSGDVLTVTGNSIIEIEPILTVEKSKCIWDSTNRASLDDPQSCDMAYRPPGGFDYDILKIFIRSGCQMPDSRGEIRISILP